eukprot:scaffold2154_cov169-Alexandrium_tamarense.AAC.1
MKERGRQQNLRTAETGRSVGIGLVMCGASGRRGARELKPGRSFETVSILEVLFSREIRRTRVHSPLYTLQIQSTRGLPRVYSIRCTYFYLELKIPKEPMKWKAEMTALKIPKEPMKWKAKAKEQELDSPLETMWAKESGESIVDA